MPTAWKFDMTIARAAAIAAIVLAIAIANILYVYA